MKALNNETDVYEDTSDYQSVESLHNNSYYDHSPTEFYPMIPEQKYRPPVDNIYRSMYTTFLFDLVINNCHKNYYVV